MFLSGRVFNIKSGISNLNIVTYLSCTYVITNGLARAFFRAHDVGMGDYPGRKQVRKRAKRAAKNDRIIAKKAKAKK
jgi:hypothetical protein